jgi:hypothetical protein
MIYDLKIMSSQVRWFQGTFEYELLRGIYMEVPTFEGRCVFISLLKWPSTNSNNDRTDNLQPDVMLDGNHNPFIPTACRNKINAQV